MAIRKERTTKQILSGSRNMSEGNRKKAMKMAKKSDVKTFGSEHKGTRKIAEKKGKEIINKFFG